MRIYPITTVQKGQLSIMARPRGNTWLADDVRALKRLNVDVVISLLEPDEVHELELTNEGNACNENGIEFIPFPIPDRSIPKDKKKFLALVSNVAALLRQEKHVVAHCRMGIGRASMIAAAVLVHEGGTVRNAFDIIKKCRGIDVPDTEEQKQWMEATYTAQGVSD